MLADLKTATLFISAPHANVVDVGADPDKSIVIGKRGSKIVFSCTWNEKRKNDMEDARSAYGNNGKVQFGPDDFVVSLGDLKIRRSPMTLGRNPNAVSPAESFTSASEDAQFLHLNATLVAHQKLATLSSKRPRPNGNMRVIGSPMAVNGAKGGRNGIKSTINVATVISPSRIKSAPLFRIFSDGMTRR